MARDLPGDDSMCLMDTSVQQAARRNTVAVTVPAGLGSWVPGSAPGKDAHLRPKPSIPGPRQPEPGPHNPGHGGWTSSLHLTPQSDTKGATL